MHVTINPGTPHVYYIQFTFYTLLPTGTTAATITAGLACPGGTYVPGPATVQLSTGLPPVTAPLAIAEGVCQYTVAAEKKYVEVTNITLVGTGPCAAGAAASTILFSEGLKSFFGTPCTVSATATGTVILKTGVNCASGEPVTGTAVPAGFLGAGVSVAGVTYSCVGGTLSAVGIPSSVFAPTTGLPVTLTITGPLGLPSGVVTLGGACAGATGGAAPVIFTNGAGVTLCPTGAGSGTISGTFVGGINTQPGVVSNTLTFTFSLPAAGRIVPTVRWAGEKAVLTKCFGGGGTYAGAAVEFTLQGSSIASASLIPTTRGPNSPTIIASADTVWTIANANGCASVIVFARSEGIVNVDAAIFGTIAGTGGQPLLNEHAFTVYYLKFDHIDLENLTFPGYAIATLTPSLAFSTGAPAGFPTFPSALPATYTLPNPPGTGQVAGPAPYSVPLCSSDFVRAMVHGYFEIPGDPSGRPASPMSIPGAPTGAPATGFSSVGTYILPAGRWVLPDDWPVLATFAGFNGTAPIQNSGVQDPSSVLAWDLNSGFVFNPSAGERADLMCGWNTLGCPNPSTPPATVSSGPITPLLGPSYGQDAAATPYSTAPFGPNCTGGDTIGIGPFDSTQACTNPFPLTYTPSGAGVLTTAPGPTPGSLVATFGPLGPNSTYLPNAVLNQWDAPMPPAQVSFGVTSGAGFLGQVNKAGLYSIDLGSAATLPAGSTTPVNPVLYPDPFYAEAIPASPLIPPITNNGGYLWNSWGFTGGAVIGTTIAGAFVPGESTTAAAFGAATCPPGFTAPFAGVCDTVSASIAGAECAALGGTFLAVPPALGKCEIVAPNPTAATVGGLNTTNFGNCVDAFVQAHLFVSNTTVTLQNAAGFVPGMTVEVYSPTTGATLDTGLTVATVTGNVLTFTPNAVTAAAPCILAGKGVFISQQFGLPIPAGTAGSFPAGTGVGLFFGGASASSTVAAGPGGTTLTGTDTAGNTLVYLVNAEGIIRALGGCVESRGPLAGPVAFGTCEPGNIVPAGTLITTGASAAAGGAPITGAPVNPYPFWQWVPNPASAAPARPTTATVYSDNHGEAVVALQTGITTSVAPVAGVCPTGYFPAPSAAAPTTCILNFATLGATGAPGFGAFPNITAALAAFTAAAPGCLNTSPTGGTTTATGATAQVGANGPAANQICVNSLGRLELGTGATLGTTTVQAVADYPYTRGDHPAIGSQTLIKVWTSAFNKSVTVSAATAGPAGTGTNSYVVTITATDVCGNPISGEPVQVYAVGNAGAIVLAPMCGGTALGVSNAVVVLGTGGAPAGTATLSLEVLTSALGNNGLLVKAVFPLEGIERFVTVIAPTPVNNTVPVIYTPGYNMVGGPPNSNFSSVEAVFSYSPTTNSYSNVTASAANLSSAAPACTGYFAYFAAATSVNIPATSKPGDTAACTLAPGWNLIGNPFASPATVPTGTTAYHFNGSGYDVVGQIPVGGAVYIFNSGTTSSTLVFTAT